MLSGAKIAVAVAVIGAVFGEWAGSDAGLGHQILLDNAQLQVPRMFAAVVVLSLMAISLFGALALIERRFAWWGERGAAQPVADHDDNVRQDDNQEATTACERRPEESAPSPSPPWRLRR